MRPKKEGTIEKKRLEEKKYAKQARDALATLIMDKMITFDGEVDYDKYGRILGYPVVDGVSVKDWLIDNRYAVKYDGGTKRKVDWKAYFAGEEDYELKF